MKRIKKEDRMRPEYSKEDLGMGVRGKYHEKYKESHNIVLLEPEVAKFFPTEESVNEALLSLIKVAQTSIGFTKGAS